MGCPASKEEEPIPEPKEAPPKKVDPRLPFKTYRQLFNMRNSWKTVVRSMTKLSKDMLLLFFQRYPQHKQLHKKLAKYTDDEKMLESQAFENAALDIFNCIDEVMECSEDKVDFAIATLQRVGKVHGTIPGFSAEYFKDMQGVFMELVQDLFGDRWNDATEENFRLLWEFCVETMVAVMGTPPPAPTPAAAPAPTPAPAPDPAPAAETAPAAAESAPAAETTTENATEAPTPNGGVEDGDTKEGEEPNRI